MSRRITLRLSHPKGVPFRRSRSAGRGPLGLPLAGQKRPAVLARGAGLHVTLDRGDELRRGLAPARPREVDLAGTPHAVALKERLERLADLLPPGTPSRLARSVASSAARRRSIAPGWARTTSARSPRASPISVVTLPGGDLGEVPSSAASPSHRVESDSMRRNAMIAGADVLEDLHPENVREQRPEHAPDARDALGARGLAQRLLPPRDALGHRPLDLGNAARDVAEEEGREDLGEDGCDRADGREAHASSRPERRPVVGPLEECRHGAGGLLVGERQHPRHDVRGGVGSAGSGSGRRRAGSRPPASISLSPAGVAVADGQERPQRRDPERLHRLGHHLHVPERDVEVEPPVARPRAAGRAS